MAPQLIIVDRDDPGLYQALCADWAGDKDVAVIVDRRVRQRRHEARTIDTDRRQTDRRRGAPVEALLAWRGGGRAARKTDVLSALNSGRVTSVAVRQRPLPKVTTASPPTVQSAADEPAVRKSPLVAPPGVIVALLILLGSISGGVVGGVAVWLFLTYEFGSALPWSTSAEPANGRPGLLAWWPLQKLLGSEPAPTRKASRA